MPQFTQSYVQIECQGSKNRTPNAAQKDQHRPFWNATIRIPVMIPIKKKAANDEQQDALSASDEDFYGEESDESDDIFFEVFVHEMHDNYSSYGKGKLILAQLCSVENGAKGGWIKLQDDNNEDNGKILYSAKVSPRELPKMVQWPVNDERPINDVVEG